MKLEADREGVSSSESVNTFELCTYKITKDLFKIS